MTLNPAGKDYGGRSKLPDNLKQLFRSVAMTVPDNNLIAELILYSEGFKFAQEIARKVVSLFQLSQQLLSPQRHYDWGLRALKTVLRIGGQLIQNERKAGKDVDASTERLLLIQALRVNTLSKLTYSDGLRFDALVSDVFPGVQVKEIDYKQVEDAVQQVVLSFLILTIVLSVECFVCCSCVVVGVE